MQKCIAAVTAILTLAPLASAEVVDSLEPTELPWLTEVTTLEPILTNTLVYDADADLCRGTLGVEMPSLPPNAIGEVDVTIEKCVVTRITATMTPNPDWLHFPAVTTYYYATGVTTNRMTSLSGITEAVNTMKYYYTLSAAYGSSTGGSCSRSGSWVQDSCAPSWINTGPTNPEGRMSQYSHSNLGNPAYHYTNAGARGSPTGVHSNICNSEDLPGTADSWSCTGFQNPYW